MIKTWLMGEGKSPVFAQILCVILDIHEGTDKKDDDHDHDNADDEDGDDDGDDDEERR